MMMRRITFVIHSLQYGGAERVAALLVNHWAQKGNAVTLVTLDEVDTDSYAIDPAVKRVALGVMSHSPTVIHAVRNNWRRIRCLRQAIAESRPDVVVSFTDKTNIVTLLAARPLPAGVVIAERIDPRRHSIGRIWNGLRQLTYPQCNALVVQTQRVCDFVRPWVKGKPVYVIPNAVPEHSDVVRTPGCDKGERAGLDQANRNRSTFHVAATGRLTEQKGFDLLIQAFSKIAESHPQWHLEILGEGPLRATLQQLIEETGLSERISLAGWVSEPRGILQRANLFVLSSRYEGFPNSLLEAMACGVPAVGFDCDSGPREIIRDGIDGVLVAEEDVTALANAMSRLMSDSGTRERMGQRAAEVMERFSLERFFRQWDAVLEGIGEEEFQRRFGE